jgi:hypothetical protein
MHEPMFDSPGIPAAAPIIEDFGMSENCRLSGGMRDGTEL